jgi:hypothetical protein
MRAGPDPLLPPSPMTASRIQPRSQPRTFAHAGDLRGHAKVYVSLTKAVCVRQVSDKNVVRACFFPSPHVDGVSNRLAEQTAPGFRRPPWGRDPIFRRAFSLNAAIEAGPVGGASNTHRCGFGATPPHAHRSTRVVEAHRAGAGPCGRKPAPWEKRHTRGSAALKRPTLLNGHQDHNHRDG